MKKLLSAAIAAAIAVVSAIAALPAGAETAESTTLPDYFGGLTLPTPETAYMTFDETHSTEGILHFTTDDKIYALLAEQDALEWDNFSAKYGLTSFAAMMQLDVSVDSAESWQYASTWDYLEGDMAYDCAANMFYLDGTNRTISEVAFDLYWDKAREPFAGTFTEEPVDGESSNYRFDAANHTIYFRTRYVINFTQPEDGDNNVMTSEWSPVSSVGKDGTQVEVTMPEKLGTVVISDLKRNDEKLSYEYKLTLSKEIFEAQKYYSIYNTGSFSGVVREVSVDNGEWREVGADDALADGIHYISYSDIEGLTDSSVIRLRVHVEGEPLSSNLSDELTSGGAEEPAVTTAEPEEAVTAAQETAPETQKCALCGICPVQPLGICLFIWIAIALAVIIIVVVIVVVVSKKKRK